MDELQSVVNSELGNLHKWLNTNKLSLNIAKTEFMIIGSRQRMSAMDDRITVEINDCEVEKVDSVKSLGVYIDKHRNWSTHIEKISKKIASANGALKRIRPYVTTDAAIHVYRALIQLHFDYCYSVWDGLGQILSSKIQKLQNRAARIVMQASYNASAGALFDVLHWDILSLRRKKFKANLMFKILNGKAPTYLQELFSVRGIGYNIRNVPKPRTDYMKKSFCYSVAVLFNSLPQDIRKCQSLPQFKKAINKYYDNVI